MERPLNVRVAEALGCTPAYETYQVSPGTQYERTEGPLWRCLCPIPPEVSGARWDVESVPAKPRHIHRGSGGSLEVARYDVSWFASGPLIQRYGIDLYRREVGTGSPWWSAILCGHKDTDDEPLIAVCKAIVQAAAAGHLLTVEEQEL